MSGAKDGLSSLSVAALVFGTIVVAVILYTFLGRDRKAPGASDGRAAGGDPAADERVHAAVTRFEKEALGHSLFVAVMEHELDEAEAESLFAKYGRVTARPVFDLRSCAPTGDFAALNGPLRRVVEARGGSWDSGQTPAGQVEAVLLRAARAEAARLVRAAAKAGES